MKQRHYDLEYTYPNVDRQRYWDLFVDHEAWSESDLLPGTITITEPGDGHPQGLGAVRTVQAGSMTITEDIVGFRAPEYFAYATRNGSLPVDDFGGEMTLIQQPDGLLVKYRGDFTPKIPGTGPILAAFLRSRQRSVLRALGKAYDAVEPAGRTPTR